MQSEKEKQSEENDPALDAVKVDPETVLNDVIGNLEGSVDKFEDARLERYGQTWERAGYDVAQVLPTLIRNLRELREVLRGDAA